ncbi:hypothetical protein EDD22DRAFT_1006115 [Suillus occidentalis]|nr:hypothetical protein EDD22DRAFT_1006115 [Suillus occidentalis]
MSQASYPSFCCCFHFSPTPKTCPTVALFDLPASSSRRLSGRFNSHSPSISHSLCILCVRVPHQPTSTTTSSPFYPYSNAAAHHTQQPSNESIANASSEAGNLQSVSDTVDTSSTLLTPLKAFNTIANEIANVHPYAKVALSIFTCASKKCDSFTSFSTDNSIGEFNIAFDDAKNIPYSPTDTAEGSISKESLPSTPVDGTQLVSRPVGQALSNSPTVVKLLHIERCNFCDILSTIRLAHLHLPLSYYFTLNGAASTTSSTSASMHQSPPAQSQQLMMIDMTGHGAVSSAQHLPSPHSYCFIERCLSMCMKCVVITIKDWKVAAIATRT